jgi:hypothetical protein
LPWAKRFFVACAFGFLVTTSIIAQLVVAIVVLAAYIGVVVKFKPFADYLTVLVPFDSSLFYVAYSLP